MRLIDSSEARAIDSFVIEELGIPSAVLMENAALAAGEVLEERFGAALRVSLICGAGNNGGDGLALARHLHSRGREVVVLLCASRHDLRGDAALQAGVLEAMALDLSEVSGETYESALQQVAGSDLVVDALFGTGLSRPIEGWRAALIEGVNAQRVPVLSLDLPSGLPATSSTMTGTCIDAVATVSFFAPKPSLVLPPSASRAGEVYVADLGVPESALGRIPPRAHLTTAADLRVPRRAAESHKGSFGHLVVAAGSHGKSGAAVLAARGALRTGVGLLTVATPEALLSEVEHGCVEAMTLALAAAGSSSLGEEAASTLLSFVAGKDALTLGPGLGNDEGTAEWARGVALAAKVPLVLDADGVNAFAGRAEELASRRAETVLTPHPGELGRLLSRPTPRGSEDRFEAATAAAAQTGAVVVLKGHRTVIATPSGLLFVNSTGNPGMATAGSGDVLAGVLGGLLAQGLDALTASRTAVYLHGLAGDLAAAKLGQAGVLAGDLAELLPEASLRVSGYTASPRRGLAHPVAEAEVQRLLA